jgi:heat shock protein HslJ
VKSDCNSCSGSYALDDGSSLDLGPVTCTQVFCGDTSLDQVYTRGLDDAQSVSMDGSNLTITGPAITLEFSR